MANVLISLVVNVAVAALLAQGTSATKREYGIGVRISEKGFNLLLQAPVRRLLSNAANATVSAKEVKVEIPAEKQLRATVSLDAGGSVVLTTGFGRDADGVLQFVDHKCDESGELGQLKGVCAKVTASVNGMNEQLKELSKRLGFQRTDGSHVGFDASLLRDPQVVKPASGGAFAKFILSGRWTNKGEKENITEGSAGLEMEDAFATQDVVFEVTNVFLDSLIQSFNESGILKNVDFNPAEVGEVMEKLNDTLGVYSENATSAATDAAEMFKTSCQVDFSNDIDADVCFGSMMGEQFQKLFPDDMMRLDVDISPEPIGVKENRVSGTVAFYARFSTIRSGKHLFDLKASTEIAIENASIANGIAYLHAAQPTTPPFEIVNDDTNGTVTLTRIGRIWDGGAKTVREKLDVWGRDGNAIPKLPFIKVVDAKMETHEGRIYFIVSKAEIAPE